MKIIKLIKTTIKNMIKNYPIYLLLIITIYVLLGGYINEILLILLVPSLVSIDYYIKFKREISKIIEHKEKISDDVEKVNEIINLINDEYKKIREIRNTLLNLEISSLKNQEKEVDKIFKRFKEKLGVVLND